MKTETKAPRPLHIYSSGSLKTVCGKSIQRVRGARGIESWDRMKRYSSRECEICTTWVRQFRTPAEGSSP